MCNNKVLVHNQGIFSSSEFWLICFSQKKRACPSLNVGFCIIYSTQVATLQTRSFAVYREFWANGNGETGATGGAEEQARVGRSRSKK